MSSQQSPSKRVKNNLGGYYGPPGSHPLAPPLRSPQLTPVKSQNGSPVCANAAVSPLTGAGNQLSGMSLYSNLPPVTPTEDLITSMNERYLSQMYHSYRAQGRSEDDIRQQLELLRTKLPTSTVLAPPIHYRPTLQYGPQLPHGYMGNQSAQQPRVDPRLQNVMNVAPPDNMVYDLSDDSDHHIVDGTTQHQGEVTQELEEGRPIRNKQTPARHAPTPDPTPGTKARTTKVSRRAREPSVDNPDDMPSTSVNPRTSRIVDVINSARPANNRVRLAPAIPQPYVSLSK